MMAQRAADHHPPGDLVSRRAAFDGAKRDYGGVDRIDIARDDRLQRDDQVPRGEHGITCQMRHAGVSGVALDRERDPPSARHDDPVMDRDRAGSESGPVVKAEDPRHRKPLEQAVGDHRASTAIAFLGRLKDEMHRSAPACVGGEQSRRTKQRCRVSVMAAGMHDAGMARGIGQPAHLGDRQRVHVRAQPDAGVRMSARQRRDHAVASDPGLEGNAEFGQPLLHEGGRQLFLQGQLGVRMQMAAPPGECLVKIWCHGTHLYLLSTPRG